MPTVEITRPTTIRELLFAEDSDTEIAVTLAAQLPPEGLAARQLGRERHLPKAAYRLLNSRIVALAVNFLDQDVAGLVVSGLGRCRALVDAAEDTLARPEDEVVVHLADPYSITSEQQPYVDVLVDDRPVGRVTFALDVSMELCETSVAVRGGAMTALDCNVCALVATFTHDGWAQPLVERRLSVPVRLEIRPPVTIPVGPSVPVARPPVPPPRPARARAGTTGR